MARRRSPVRKKSRRSRSYSSDSRSYSRSRSRSPSTSEPSRGGLRQPPQLRGSGAGLESRKTVTDAELLEKSARITALESELAQTRKSNEDLQKQLVETARKLKKAEAAQGTYERWLEAIVGVADQVVKDQATLQKTREAVRKLEDVSNQGKDDLALYVKETNAFLAEQAEKQKTKKVSTPQEVVAEKAEAAKPPVSVSENVTESQSVFRPGIKFKLNP